MVRIHFDASDTAQARFAGDAVWESAMCGYWTAVLSPEGPDPGNRPRRRRASPS